MALHIFPISPDISLTATELHVQMLPWGSCSCMCMSGKGSEGENDKHVIVAYEWPMTTINLPKKLTKLEKERLHLERLITDSHLSIGASRLDSCVEGDDPPDFYIVRGDIRIGVDLAQFTLAKRRRANAIFEKLKEEISSIEPKAFSNLRGTMVYVDFGLDGKRGNEIPFTAKYDSYKKDLIKELSNFSVDEKKWRTEGFQQKLPELNEGSSSGGAGFVVAPLSGSVPSTNFFYRMGFELGLAFYTRLSVTEIWNEIWSRVESHDKNCIDEILISAGAPSESGVSYPSDEILALEALKHPQIIAGRKTKHIKSVVIHIWSTGEIWEVYPEYKQIAPRLYQGSALMHHPLLQVKS